MSIKLYSPRETVLHPYALSIPPNLKRHALAACLPPGNWALNPGEFATFLSAHQVLPGQVVRSSLLQPKPNQPVAPSAITVFSDNRK